MCLAKSPFITAKKLSNVAMLIDSNAVIMQPNGTFIGPHFSTESSYLTIASC